MRSTLRKWLRQTGLVRAVEPLVALVERRRLARICDYQVEETSEEEVTFLFNGRRVGLPVAPPQFRQMALSRHERPTTTVFLKYVRSGDTAWDVGANVGYYTCLLARLAGEGGSVFAFEPNPANFRVLQSNVSELRLGNVHLLNAALADFEGEARLGSADRVTPESRLLETNTSTDAAGEMVKVTTGNALVRAGKATPPDFIKVDVEGFEPEVLRGMQAVLAAPRCRTLLCEVHFALLAARGKIGAENEMAAGLRAAGFNRIHWVSRSHLLALKQ